MYASWDMEYNRYNFFVVLGHFLLFYHPKKQESQNFEKKRKKYQDISPFYTCAPQMTIIWYMAPEIWSTTDIIICHFDYFGSLSPNTLENQNVEKMKKVAGDIIILHLYTT